jgi:hypothetical protein
VELTLHLALYILQMSIYLKCVVTQHNFKNNKLVGWFMVLNATFIFQLYRGDLFHWWRKQHYPEKTTDLPHVTGEHYHIMLYRANLVMNRVRTHNFSGDRN